MLRRLFPFSFNEDASNGNGRNGSASHHNGAPEPAAEPVAAAECPPEPALTPARKQPQSAPTFDLIYQNAAVKPPRLAWGITKVAEMVNSEHVAGMSADARRCSVLMALEAAGAAVEDLLQDAMVRQRALNDYEDAQMRTLKDFEAAKLEENRAIQAELDSLTAQYLSRIQANLDEIASAQDRFRAWQKQKQQESQRIADAAAFCVPPGNANSTNLTAVLERATAARR